MDGSVSGQVVTLVAGFTREYLWYHRVCPVAVTDGGELEVAIAPTARREALSELSIASGRIVSPRDVSDEELARLVERVASAAERAIEVAGPDENAEDDTTDVRVIANQPPVVRYVNLMVRDAYEAAASDIHLESTRDGLAVRFRLDGLLNPAQPPADLLQHAVTSRIKLLAELDISERRRPQDGRLRVRLDARDLDVRVSTVPTMHGESVVLRLLDNGGTPVGLDDLGMPETTRRAMKQAVTRPHGLVLVTGPTGSGKTTTLYASLLQRDLRTEKVLTVEDPIEYELPGVAQVPVHREAGVTFGTALRALLRQDPDVIMIGETRDRETAEVAVQSAMTGHMVLTTLHTNDAVGALARLSDLGVPVFLITATLEAVLAQRLVRKVCTVCAAEYSPSDSDLEHAGLADSAGPFVRGAGCARCRGTGYRGRTGIFEYLDLRDELRAAVLAGATEAELRRVAQSTGMQPLLRHGISKAQQGITTLEEVLRVVAS